MSRPGWQHGREAGDFSGHVRRHLIGQRDFLCHAWRNALQSRELRPRPPRVGGAHDCALPQRAKKKKRFSPPAAKRRAGRSGGRGVRRRLVQNHALHRVPSAMGGRDKTERTGGIGGLHRAAMRQLVRGETSLETLSAEIRCSCVKFLGQTTHGSWGNAKGHAIGVARGRFGKPTYMCRPPGYWAATRIVFLGATCGAALRTVTACGSVSWLEVKPH